MNLVVGNALWKTINEIPVRYASLKEDIDCEIAIVGGGITGALCAYYLTEAGIDTILLEKDIVGFASTSASTSILQYEIDNDLYIMEKTMGQKAAEAFRLCYKAVDDIANIITNLEDNCGFTRTSCLYYSNKKDDEKALRKELKAREAAGFNVEFLDEKKGGEMFSFPMKAGIYSKDGAAQVDPYKFTHALLSYNTKVGLKIFEKTEVKNIDSYSDHVILTTSDNHKIKAKKYILAVGYVGKDYVNMPTVSLSRSFNIVTKPVKDFSGWFNKCIIRDTSNPYTYLRVTLDYRIIIGGEDLPVKQPGDEIDELSDNNGQICINKYNALEDRLRFMFPDIKDLEIEYTFNGIFGNTSDGLPYAGTYGGRPNCYLNFGFGSNGILYSNIGAKLIRDSHMGVYNPAADLFSFGR